MLIEQLDAIALSRGDYYCAGDAHDRLLTTLLTEIDGIFSTAGAPSVIIIGVASDPTVIDGALLRAGRLDYHVEVPLPDCEQRLELLREWVRRNRRFKIGREVLEGVARRTEGASPAVLLNIFKEAALLAFRDNIHTDQVDEKYFAAAFHTLTASSKPLRPTKPKVEVPVPKFTLDIPLEFHFGVPGSAQGKAKDLPLPVLSEDLRKSLVFLNVMPAASPSPSSGEGTPLSPPQPAQAAPPKAPRADDVQLIMKELEVSKQIAEQSLVKSDNNLVETLRSLLVFK
uniref:Vesicle-fusing ATPase n=1 Tax=Arcella intermedia TaxID=1963864 RepID=A0A6B2LA17_9EUKA